MVRADVWPKQAEPTMCPLLVKEAAISPDARWVAMVTRHLCGPEDIIVLAKQ